MAISLESIVEDLSHIYGMSNTKSVEDLYSASKHLNILTKELNNALKNTTHNLDISIQ